MTGLNGALKRRRFFELSELEGDKALGPDVSLWLFITIVGELWKEMS